MPLRRESDLWYEGISGGGGNATVALGPGASFIGIVTVANSQTNTGNVTLNQSPNFIGLVTAVAIGNVADNAVNSGNPVLVGGVYYSTATTYGDGDRTSSQYDVNGNQKMTLATQIAGEDLTNDLTKVEQRFSYATLTSNTTTAVKGSAGFLHLINIGFVSCPTLTIYDNTVPSGTVIHRFGVNPPVGTYRFDVTAATGISVDATAAGAAPYISVSYR